MRLGNHTYRALEFKIGRKNRELNGSDNYLYMSELTRLENYASGEDCP